MAPPIKMRTLVARPCRHAHHQHGKQDGGGGGQGPMNNDVPADEANASATHTRAFVLQLPVDVLLRIVAHLDYNYVVRTLPRVCRAWRDTLYAMYPITLFLSWKRCPPGSKHKVEDIITATVSRWHNMHALANASLPLSPDEFAALAKTLHRLVYGSVVSPQICTAIAGIPTLRALDLRGSNMTTLAPFVNHKSRIACLQEINVSETTLRDMDALAGTRTARTLTTLDISHTKTRSLSPLSQCDMLTTLHAAHASSLTTADPLHTCYSLRHLDLSHTAVANVAALGELPLLHTLILRGSRLAPDGGGLVHCVQLRMLDVSHTALVETDWCLALQRVETLILAHTAVNSIMPLGALPSLDTLDISHTAVTTADSLGDAAALRTLILGNVILPVVHIQRCLQLRRLAVDADTMQHYRSMRARCALQIAK